VYAESCRSPKLLCSAASKILDQPFSFLTTVSIILNGTLASSECGTSTGITATSPVLTTISSLPMLISASRLWGLHFNPIIAYLRPISPPFSSISHNPEIPSPLKTTIERPYHHLTKPRFFRLCMCKVFMKKGNYSPPLIRDGNSDSTPKTRRRRGSRQAASGTPPRTSMASNSRSVVCPTLLILLIELLVIR